MPCNYCSRDSEVGKGKDCKTNSLTEETLTALINGRLENRLVLARTLKYCVRSRLRKVPFKDVFSISANRKVCQNDYDCNISA